MKKYIDSDNKETLSINLGFETRDELTFSESLLCERKLALKAESAATICGKGDEAEFVLSPKAAKLVLADFVAESVMSGDRTLFTFAVNFLAEGGNVRTLWKSHLEDRRRFGSESDRNSHHELKAIDANDYEPEIATLEIDLHKVDNMDAIPVFNEDLTVGQLQDLANGTS